MASKKIMFRVWLLCANCGVAMMKKNSYAARTKNVTCGRKCMGEFNSKTMLGASNPNFRNFPAKVCLKCGKNFFTREHKRKFCSHQCFVLARTDPKKKEAREREKAKANRLKFVLVHGCVICLAPVSKGVRRCKKCKVKASGRFKIKTCGKCGENSTQMFRVNGPKYFHKQCRDRSGERNSNYKGGLKDLKAMIRDNPKIKEIRKKVFFLDGFSCRMCGQVGGNLQADHVRKFSEIFQEFVLINHGKTKDELCALSESHYEFWDLNNFQTLCKACNFKKELNHRSFKKLERRLKSEEIISHCKVTL
jgi:hypothetical protein